MELRKIISKTPAWPIYAVSVSYAALVFVQALNGDLGPDPVDAMTAISGKTALQLLLLGLCLTPLVRFAKINLLKFRRAIGLSAFFFATLHMLVWGLLDLSLRWSQMIEDVLTKPFLSIGMASVFLMIPLAITSNSKAIKKMGGKAWNKLHKLTYPVVLLGAAHFVIGSKVLTWEAAAYMAAALCLVALRLPYFKPRRA